MNSRASIDGHRNGVRELGARIIKIDVAADMAVLIVVIVEEWHSLETVLLLQ